MNDQSKSKWRIYLGLGRVSNLPTVWSNTLAGVVLAQPEPRASALGVFVLAVSFSLFYVGGVFLNDAFDRAIDARERPERPIVTGAISAREVFTVGFGLLGAGLALLAVHSFALEGNGGGWSILSGAGLAGAIVLYDVWHKGNPISPILMGLCRVLVYVTAAIATVGHVDTHVLVGAALLLSYLMGLTYVAKQENLTEFRNMWPLVLLFIPFAVVIPKASSSLVLSTIFVCFIAWVTFAVSLLRKKATLGKGVIPRVVVSLIAGISLLDAMLIAAHGSAGVAIVAALGFGATLFFQRYVSGT